MGKLKQINCCYCKCTFDPTGPAQKMCSNCRVHIKSINSQVVLDMARFEKFGTYDTIGKGQNSPSGKDSVHYTDGIGLFHKYLSPAVKTRRYCDICGKDLKDAGRYEWCAHHKDFERGHNTIDNIQLLCKRCHQMVHNCIGNLPNN